MKGKIIDMKNLVLTEGKALRYYFLLYWCQNFSKQAYINHRTKHYENLWKF